MDNPETPTRGKDISRLRTIIAEKTWVGFDLDDTLHEFRRSSGIATNKILDEISKRFGIHMPELKD
jgi:putative hydrolase of the HAD superfamily